MAKDAVQREGMAFGRGKGERERDSLQTEQGEAYGMVNDLTEEEAGGCDQPAEHQKLEGFGQEAGDRRVDKGGDQEREQADHAEKSQRNPDRFCHADLDVRAGGLVAVSELYPSYFQALR